MHGWGPSPAALPHGRVGHGRRWTHSRGHLEEGDSTPQPTPGAIYARVASEQPAAAQTRASQGAAWRERLAAAGLTVSEAMPLLDAGESGATLGRPALARLRDVVAAGSVDRLAVHAPERLARPYASPGLLVDAVRRAGGEVVVLTRALGQSPADALLLPGPGMLAEDERAKSIERHRRGKRPAARVGGEPVRSGAPLGSALCPQTQGVDRPARSASRTKPAWSATSVPGGGMPA